ncbi:uncharacterized protein [Amphiura filiformis]|uniref:uncharacterized protein n=1 Tax=Amphiura filiformis TaxID=82378 RepID=UPI003B21A7B9
MFLIGNGLVAGKEQTAKLTGEVKIRTISSRDSTMWMILETDNTGQLAGFHLQIEKLPARGINALCEGSDYHCGSGFCVSYNAKCDGFTDCYANNADELRCAYIHCPGSYLCDKAPDVNISKCVTMDEVCDGEIECPGGDDETFCDVKKCPDDCSCQYEGESLIVSCEQGWADETLNNMARTSNSLVLSEGHIGILEPAIFKGLANLHTLSLEGNSIDILEQGCFDGLYNVTWLDLSRNNMSYIQSNSFEGMPILQELYLWDVPLTTIHSDAFAGATLLKTLVLIRERARYISITVHENGFRGLTALRKLYVDDHHLCCHFDTLDDCITLEPQPPLFMCGSLMQNSVLRISMWILGISALIGNAYVIVLRIREKTKNLIAAKQSVLIGSLAVSDCLMGVYMVILASVDVYYGDEYFIYSDDWRSSGLCKLESFLSLLSSEASVFFITLITFDRFLCIVFPLSTIKFHLRSCRVATLIAWLIAFVLALVPTLLAGPESEFYDLSDVCIGLPLITRPTSYNIESSDVGGLNSARTFDLPVPEQFKPAWFFSIFIFLGLNLVCFLFIFVCYFVMFINVKIVRQKMKGVINHDRDADLKLAVKMSAIVGTDFICWMPVIIMGLLSQTGAAVIPLQMYTWSVVFIIPINSSLNPYLYTIATLITDYRKQES